MSTTPTDRRSALARRLRIDIDTATYPASQYQILRGVYELAPIIEPRVQDDEVYDDEGWLREATTGAQWRLEPKIKYSLNEDGSAFDTVHRFLRTKFLASVTGPVTAGEFGIRIYDREGLDSGYEYEGRAYVKAWTRDGNASGDVENVTLVIQGQGPLTEITNPEADLTPVVTGLSPATGDEAGGELINVYGNHFTGATDVDFGANPADGYTIVNDSHIVAVAPAGTAGTVAVRVTTDAGQSADTAADNYVYT
ncbi:phage tail tube protein [Micromonospora andamanensis]|uniref:IPT/TIG domain-containing protein n=1 Tax=Micromonospora andamanensis TaxID=1287068 RepID=A0ABQ4HYM9_9ACTN|nr:IPT/TIG domain-containing protein [Micromonospora andamanensis]GIJ10730.1 hypothetical protein Van01_39440 [Micromonospora andamanensis]